LDERREVLHAKLPSAGRRARVLCHQRHAVCWIVAYCYYLAHRPVATGMDRMCSAVVGLFAGPVQKPSSRSVFPPGACLRLAAELLTGVQECGSQACFCASPLAAATCVTDLLRTWVRAFVCNWSHPMHCELPMLCPCCAHGVPCDCALILPLSVHLPLGSCMQPCYECTVIHSVRIPDEGMTDSASLER
jgi:hypothetical protein